jgi:Cytochrome c
MMNRFKPSEIALASLLAAVASLVSLGLAVQPAMAAGNDSKASASAAKKPDLVARGRYLVNSTGCHDCHTPFKMGANGPEPDMSRMLSGHPEGLVMPPAPQLPAGPWMIVSSATNTAHAGPWGVSFTANLTPHAQTGLGEWSLSNFTDTIRTGRHMGRGRPVLPPMPIPAYNNLDDADLEAIYRYLRTIPAINNRVPEPWAPPAASSTAQK